MKQSNRIIKSLLSLLAFAVAYVSFGAVGAAAGTSLAMALPTEVWVNDIKEVLYPQTEFMAYMTDHSQFINNLTVHIPQQTVRPTIRKNYTSLPINASSRTDSDFTYSLNNYKAEPFVIPNLEELQISYSKRASVMRSYYNELKFTVQNQTLYAIAPTGASSIVKTTGSAVSSALAPSATGTRNAITLADILSAKNVLDLQNVPQDGRILLMDASMYNAQFLNINNVQAFYASNMEAMKTGVVGTIFGFKVMVRPTVLVYDNSFVPKAVSDNGVPSSPASTDELACIAFHPDFVSKALQEPQIYIQENVPQYYGPVLSCELQHGASTLYTAGTGVVAIVQQ